MHDVLIPRFSPPPASPPLDAARLRAAELLVRELVVIGNRLPVVRRHVLATSQLSSATFRLLRGIDRLPVAFTVAELARTLRLSRQAVKKVADAAHREGLIGFRINERHRNAPLVVLTPAGRERLTRAARHERRWLEELTHGFELDLLQQTRWVLTHIRRRL